MGTSAGRPAPQVHGFRGIVTVRRLTRLLRWYPREWRDRYGEEFLAMVEDTLDGGRPTLRLRMSVVLGGLRERRHRVLTGLISPATLRRLKLADNWSIALLAALTAALLPALFKAAPPASEAGLARAAQDALIGVFVLAGIGVVAGGLVALPAFGRFLRAGGWPKIRRRVAWATAATAAAGGAAWPFSFSFSTAGPLRS